MTPPTIEERLYLETYLDRNAPALAALYRAEGLAAGTHRNDVTNTSKLPMIRDLLRAAIIHITGRDFENMLYPEQNDKDRLATKEQRK